MGTAEEGETETGGAATETIAGIGIGTEGGTRGAGAAEAEAGMWGGVT